jgi:MerR family mercuric resistance operon transcriptional regulator
MTIYTQINSVPNPRVKAFVPQSSNPTHLTIGRLAREADVGLETICYYQTRNLIPVPTESGGYRQYPVTLIARIHFIKRAQELGFALDEIGELLRLDEKIDKRTIRNLAKKKIEQVQLKLNDLQRIQTTLQQLVHHCSHSATSERCPIIASLCGTET